MVTTSVARGDVLILVRGRARLPTKDYPFSIHFLRFSALVQFLQPKKRRDFFSETPELFHFF